MKLNILASSPLLSKISKKLTKKGQVIYISSVDLPSSDFKGEIVKDYTFDNYGHIYFTEKKVLSFHI